MAGIDVATNTSSGEKPSLRYKLDFAKAIHRNCFDCRRTRQCDRRSSRRDPRPRIFRAYLLMDRAIRPEFERLRGANGHVARDLADRAAVVRTAAGVSIVRGELP